MAERSANDNEEDEQPEKSNELDVSSAELVDGHKCDYAACDSTNRNDYQTPPDIVNQQIVNVLWR